MSLLSSLSPRRPGRSDRAASIVSLFAVVASGSPTDVTEGSHAHGQCMFRYRAALIASLLLGLSASATNVASPLVQAPATRLDRAALLQSIESLLKERGGDIDVNLWLGGDRGKAWFELNAARPAA